MFHGQHLRPRVALVEPNGNDDHEEANDDAEELL